MANFAIGGAQAHSPNKSFEIKLPPTDGISSLSFSPKANYLVGTSWDDQARCWEIQANGSSDSKAISSHLS